MRQCILNIAYPLAPVGPDVAGGAEQVVSALDRMLVESGNQSVVIACEGSQICGTHVATPRFNGLLTEEVRAQAHRAHRAAIAKALQQWPVDLIHFHGLDFDAYVPETDVPMLVTLHVPAEWYSPEALSLKRPNLWMHCVSQTQMSSWPGGSHHLPPIENGVDTDRLNINARKRDYALALGRISPEKGFQFALDAAKAARIPLLLAGEVYPYPAHQQYFRDDIEPRLDSTRRFIGPVGLHAKRRLLTQARCLLIPSVVAETSSLVAMEALACGTPVIAFRRGALPEIIEHGRTGFVVDTVQQMAEAIPRTRELDPETCRATARARFSLKRMREQYLACYQTLAGYTLEKCRH